MEHWKQPDKGRQHRADQQHSHKNQAKISPPANKHNNQHQSHNHHNSNLNSNSKQAATDPIKSIANVLNQHSKFVQQNHQKKAQQQEALDQQVSLQQTHNNKLDQSQQQLQQFQQRAIGNQLQNSIAGKDTLSSAGLAPLTAAFSQSSNQVDQGNSYLYAYNDFITYTNAAAAAAGARVAALNQHQEQLNQLSARSADLTADLRNHNRHYLQQQPQESLIDSDEDDALSYILHQHRLQAAHEQNHHSAASLNYHRHLNQQHQHFEGAHLNPCFQEQEAHQHLQSENFLEAHRIDHHLSCSRSSHPRHICGIGGSQNDNLNHIAARLREESQKAFALNQKSRSKNQSATIQLSASQTDQFTHDLTAIQDQLATVVNPLAYRHRESPLDEADADASYLNLNNEQVHLTSRAQALASSGGVALTARGGAAVHLGATTSSLAVAGRRLPDNEDEIATANDSNSNSNSNSDLSRPTTTLTTSHLASHHSDTRAVLRPIERRRSSGGYLNWLFCCLCNLISSDPSEETSIKRHQSRQYETNILNAVNKGEAGKRRGNKKRKKASYGLHAPSEASIITAMYSNNQQQQLGAALGPLGGQAGAYYPTQTGGGTGSGGPPGSTAGSDHHHHYAHNHQHMLGNHPHPHHHQHHHYPLSSDSSLSSTGFASSAALRMNAFFKSCCSKKCLFVSCLMLILLIFIFVIGLSAYLNFLINLNKTNLIPVSGRLRVEDQGDSYSDQLANRTSKEFLAKQQQYETILRGAFDRNQQNLLKTYPNHLVKLEVYNFKPGSLWVYFRLFVNKRTLMQDTQLMKRKSPDEHLDRQFLPRLTQQTLHSGFEQLVAAFSSRASLPANRLQQSTSGSGADLLRQPRLAAANQHQERGRVNSPAVTSQQKDNVKSFDEQISRLMPIIESIDLQSIMVTAEFDMLQGLAQQQQQQQQSVSDNLRASQFLSTSSSTVMVASGGSVDKSLATEYDIGSPTSTPKDGLPVNQTTSFAKPTLQPEPADVTGSSEEVNVSTKKFTLYGYKENITRPTTSSRPRQYESPFLVNQSQKPGQGRSSAVASATNPSETADFVSTASSASNPSVDASTFRPIRTQELISMTKPAVEQQFEQPAGGRERQMVKLAGQQQQPAGLQNNNNSSRLIATLFAQFPQQQPNSTIQLEFSSSSSDANSTASRNSGGLQKSGATLAGKGVNETVAILAPPMIAPYQKIDFSTTSASSQLDLASSQSSANIEDLWDKALSQSHKKNSTTNPQLAKIDSSSSRQLDSGGSLAGTGEQQAKRLITITTTGAARNQPQNFSNLAGNNNLDWHKISVLSSDISDTIRAQLQNASLASTTLSPIIVTNGPQLKPKVSPHLKQGGSLISITLKQPETSEQGQNSSKLLQGKPDKRPAFDGQPRAPVVVNDLALVQQKRNASKPIIRQQQVSSKLKKVNSNGEIANQQVRSDSPSARPANGTSNNSKGIRIVDNFLASLESSGNRTQQFNSTNAMNLHQRNKTLENFSYNADQFAPTQPTTIELTRSTTSSPPPRTTSRQNSANSDYTTTSSAPQRYLAPSSPSPVTESAIRVVGVQSSSPIQPRIHSNVYQQPARPAPNGTPSTNFSNQWRPISTNSNQTGQRRPQINNNMPSNSGSQSPFAMSPSILDTNSNEKLTSSPVRLDIASQLNRRPTSNRLSNSYQIVGSAGGGNNEFESHRMSRMRQQTSDQNPGLQDIFGPNQAASSSTTTTTTSESASRVIDDFSATTTTTTTTEKVDGGMRSSTLLPPVVLSNLRSSEPPVASRALSSMVSALDLVPKRTRGPFAFETLKSLAMSPAPNAFESPINGLLSGDQLAGQRSERSSERLLVRKKLFIGDDDESNRLLIKPASHNATDIERFGNRAAPERNHLDLVRDETSDVAQDFGGAQSFKCQYYGCRAKGLNKFICLDRNQICNDEMDCEDNSDELDCVSLLKYDSKSNRLSFSNGGGIIYLNRKGSLAPMCIDYFTHPADNRLATNTATHHELENAAKKQQELIKQINTIGQYACSLQSFSRLVSVKINHHDLVDGLDLIKNSKLYHRLSIVGASDKSDEGSDHESFKSGTSEHEVEVSTSTHCPSQRTVFVKCGDFECGQDSFSVIDSNDANSTKRKDGLIINDFPWLVKLYWLGSLSCHGYLIDEMWMITSSECFANKSLATNDLNGWTAEISYEHYGNDDYQSIESNRRSIKEIIMQPSDSNPSNSAATVSGPAIVLAKLEKPVRFSPLNRPICLPLSLMNKTTAIDRIYKGCVSVALPLAGPPTHDLILSKVELHKTSDCLNGADLQRSGTKAESLICVSELARNDSGSQIKEGDATRVLICPSSQTNRSRSKWTIVGVQNKPRSLPLNSDKQLFTTVSSQIDWIVDTMNPNAYPSFNLEGGDSNGNELNLMSTLAQRNQTTCDRFRCSNGECIEWSKICDGIYDCKGTDLIRGGEDEKDCYK